MFTFSTLVAPLSTDEFLSGYWPDRPVRIPNDAEKLMALMKEVPELASAEELLANYPDRVSLLRPDGFFSSVPNGATALPFYRAEYTAFVRRVERYVPQLGEIATRVADALGMPRSSLGCDLFMSSGNESTHSRSVSGLAMHSDAEVSFALLIEGVKRWSWAPNTHIRNQTTTVNRDGDRPIDPQELLLADELPMPASMPADCERVEATGGDLIFLPRGWWHTTQAQGKCMQLNFTLEGPTLIDVVTKALAADLRKDPRWRQYAYGLENQKAEELHGQLGMLLSEVATRIASPNAAEEICHDYLTLPRKRG
jgi:50S ribosomal protein L16 3-hydroxylase